MRESQEGDKTKHGNCNGLILWCRITEDSQDSFQEDGSNRYYMITYLKSDLLLVYTNGKT